MPPLDGPGHFQPRPYLRFEPHAAGWKFHARAVRFTSELCRLLEIAPAQLPGAIDYLFKGCVTEWKRTRRAPELDPESENELITATVHLLRAEGVPQPRVDAVARQLETLSRDFFTIGMQKEPQEKKRRRNGDHVLPLRLQRRLK